MLEGRILQTEVSGMPKNERNQNPQNFSSQPDLSSDKDQVMEQILDNVNNTPLGQVLKRIGSLPEVRQKKVLNIRKEITRGQYGVDDRLDAAIDRVLEDIVN
jgi:anti-sigma28 factor (negative regulator of flagellin synthesis)